MVHGTESISGMRYLTCDNVNTYSRSFTGYRYDVCKVYLVRLKAIVRRSSPIAHPESPSQSQTGDTTASSRGRRAANAAASASCWSCAPIWRDLHQKRAALRLWFVRVGSGQFEACYS